MDLKQQAIDSAKTFESILLLKDDRAKRVTWWVAGSAIALAFLSIAALLVALPLKHTELTIIRVDNVTGRSEIVTTVTEGDIPAQLAQDKFFTGLYVRLREGYNYYSLQRDYDTVPLYGADAVNADYLALFQSKQSPEIIYSNESHMVDIEIISNSISEATEPDRLASIRFKKNIKSLRTGVVKTEYFVARLTFRMDPTKEMTEEIRNVNPMGFMVTSYQVDKEMRESR